MQRPLVNETVRRNAEVNAKIKGVYTADEKGNPTYSVLEGGFRRGSRAKVIDPADFYCGHIGVVSFVASERTVHVNIDGKTFSWCVAALEPA